MTRVTKAMLLFAASLAALTGRAQLATGGAVTTDVGGFFIHTFTAGGTFTVTAPYSVYADILLVGGGGGATSGGMSPSGAVYGAGAAGGQVTYVTSVTLVSGVPYTVTVGSGGTGIGPALNGNDGGASWFGAYNAQGGQGSRAEYGGSNASFAGAGYQGGAYSGGGAGGNGPGAGRMGGSGYSGTISGAYRVYAGGGSAGGYPSVPASIGSGGGDGSESGDGGNATYYGGGGGGAPAPNLGGNGYQGIVIVRYREPTKYVAISGQDLDAIFEPLGAKADIGYNTNFQVNGVDIRGRYMPIGPRTPVANTGYQVGGVDLSQIFCPKGQPW